MVKYVVLMEGIEVLLLGSLRAWGLKSCGRRVARAVRKRAERAINDKQ